MSHVLDPALDTTSTSSDSDFWASVTIVDSYSERHLWFLREKLELIFAESNGQDSQELSSRIQKTIFRSRLHTEMRRKISGSVAQILRNFPKISPDSQEELKSQILKVTENIQKATHETLVISERVSVSEVVIPTHQLMRSTIFWDIPGFQASEEQLGQIGEGSDYWFILLLEILDITPLRKRDICFYRFCEMLLATRIVSHELIYNVMHIGVLKILMDTSKIKIYLPLAPESREWFWREHQMEKALIDPSFVGPRLTEKIHTISLLNRGDVSGDFAWSVDLLVKKFEKLKNEMAISYATSLESRK